MKLSIKIGLFQDITCLTVFGLNKKANGSTFQLLFDLELNTIVSRELVNSETINNIYNFLNQTLHNQNKKCIITDLKTEYRIAIDRLGVKQQFCTFHLKQLINREKRNYIKENNESEEEIEIIHNYKQLFFNIINAESINEAQEKRNQLFYLKSNIPPNYSRFSFKINNSRIQKKSQIT